MQALKATVAEPDLQSATNATSLDLGALEAMALQHEPFDFIVVPDFVRRGALDAIIRDYPDITRPGNFKLEKLNYGPAFAALIAELGQPAVRNQIADKFDVDLTDCRHSVTVRRYSDQTDGRIHVDHPSKIITMLVYINESWDSDEGRLRLLRNDKDIENYVAEVPPNAGTMIAFRRSDTSFHGYKPFVGERRMIQMAWVRENTLTRYERSLSRLSKPLRRLLNMS